MTHDRHGELWCGTCFHETSPSAGVRSTSAAKDSIFVPYGKLFPSSKDRGFTILRWGSTKGLSAHSLEDVESIILRALAEFNSRWSYLPPNLYVSFVKMAAMGRTVLAAGPDDPHLIELNKRLVQAYDANSIRRVMLHELSHCMRHQVSNFVVLDEPHDPRFCSILEGVDPLVAGSKKKCKFFTDDVDESVAQRTLGSKLRAGGTLKIQESRGRREFELRSAARQKLRSGPLRVQELLEIAAALGDRQEEVEVILYSPGSARVAEALPFDRFFAREIAKSSEKVQRMAAPFLRHGKSRRARSGSSARGRATAELRHAAKVKGAKKPHKSSPSRGKTKQRARS